MASLGATPGMEFLARAALIATALYAFSTGLKIYQGSGIWPPAVPLSLVLYVMAAGCLIAAFVLREPRSRAAVAVIGVILLVATALSAIYEIDFANPSYGTDAMAFAHTSGEILLDGGNPYDVEGGPLISVINRFNLPDSVVTRTNAGQPVDRLVSYPGGHVLTYAGGVALGLDDLRWVTLGFEVAALVFIWLVVSPVARLFIPFALLMEDNLTVFFTSGAVTDWLWVLPLVVAAYYMQRERFGLAGLALGLATAMKQQPWFVVPFALIWVYKMVSDRGKTPSRDAMTMFIGGLGSGFLLLNIPFMVWSFESWWGGILHPALGDLVPDGQGFSVLASRGILPIPGEAYGVALGVVTIVVIWAYYKWFDRLQDLLWVLPPALLLLSHRSFHSYFIYWVPLALIWLDFRINRPGKLSAQQPVDSGNTIGVSRSAALVAVALAVVVGVAAIAPNGSKGLDVGDVTANVTDGVITSLEVELTNNSGREAVPVFELYWRGQPVPWEPVALDRVGVGQTAIIEIVPSSADGVPPVQLDPDGKPSVVGFRVRVNDSGESVYSSSQVVEVSLDDVIVNPEFHNWTRRSTIFASPYGWRSAQRGGTDLQRFNESYESGAGAVLGVSSDGSGPDDWVETALLQDVGSIEACYRWNFSSSLLYRTDRSGSPLAVGGVQVVQGDATLWFVPSEVSERQTTMLSDGTVVVELEATEGAEDSKILDVGSYADSVGLDLERPGLVKVFNAVHQTIAARSELTTTLLEGVDCSAG